MNDLHTGADDFDAAWHDSFRRHRDLIDSIAAVIRLTDGGAGSPWHQTEHSDDRVWLDLSTTEAPRFWYQIGHRRIGVAGCAPDVFLAAQALEVPMRVETACPVTGVAITVGFTPDGVTEVEPAGTVVAAIHPGAAPEALEVTDAARVDADLCLQQPFFANAEAAELWLARHPGGRVVPVATFDRWWRRLRADATGPVAPRVGADPPRPAGSC